MKVRGALFAATLLANIFALSGPAGANDGIDQTEQSSVNQEQQDQSLSADQQLTELFDEEWALRKRELGIRLDDEKPVSFLPQVDKESQDRRAAAWREILNRTNEIDRSTLSRSRQVDLAVFETIVGGFLMHHRWKAYEMPLNSDTSFWSTLGQSSAVDIDDYESYLSKLRQYPRFFAQNIENMRAGLARGFSVSKVSLKGIEHSISAYITDDPEANPLYQPFREIPASIDEKEAARLRAEARKVLVSEVMPAYADLLAFMKQVYVPNARQTTAARDFPAGDAYYADFVRYFTTLDMTPDEIHNIGLREVEKLKREIAQAAKAAGIEGSVAEVFSQLRVDPRYTAKTPEQLLHRSAWIAKQVDAQIAKIIGKLPKRPFTIKPVPDELAPFYTSGRGGLEACWMNTYNLPARPLYALTALTLHECAPGHSMQMGLAAEQDDKPNFRRTAYFSGYGEGWGLYSEWLGVEMGLYKNPADELGRLSYSMWRASRLVVDTGLHHYNWSREEAVDYMRRHTALSEHEIGTEIDRYIAWPGQALAYKLGELEIKNLRDEAQTVLRDDFDVREFHDTILALGAVPLSVLRTEMRAWISRSRKDN